MQIENMNDENQPRKLPLWRSCLQTMQEKGLVGYGSVIEASFFEEHLSCERTTMEFGLGISAIRRELENDGVYLSGRGQKGEQFVILPPAANADVMAGYQRMAIDALKRGVILGTNTRLDLLSDQERRKHESMLERIATRAVLVSRAKQVIDVIAQHKPKLLSERSKG
jgi:hypothetical protein